jgi:hypothetical protein
MEDKRIYKEKLRARPWRIVHVDCARAGKYRYEVLKVAPLFQARLTALALSRVPVRLRSAMDVASPEPPRWRDSQKVYLVE